MLKYHIQTIEVPSGGTSAITFSNIPQTFDDIEVVLSLRVSVTDANFRIRFNNSSAAIYNERLLQGSGSSAISASASNASALNLVYSNTSSQTANTFSSHKIFVPNYKNSTAAKSISIEGVSENNATAAVQYLNAALFNSISAITSMQIFYNSGLGEVVQHSSASLYGIKRGSDGRTEVASGGTITTSGGFTIHTFTGSGTFVANRNLDVDYLVVAGGAAGGASGAGAGGGGAGGYRSSVFGELSGGNSAAEPRLRLSAGASYAVTVGAGGASVTASGYNTIRNNGSNSSVASIVANGGGGGSGGDIAGAAGGSGGGGNGGYATIGGAATPNQGFTGGQGRYLGNSGGLGEEASGGGGGGAGAVGVDAGFNPNAVGGNGGAGIASSINGTAVTRAGGGGGGIYESNDVVGSGGSGGGGNGGFSSGGSGQANTGSGGGGAGSLGSSVTSGAGGSGVVIIRYLTPA